MDRTNDDVMYVYDVICPRKAKENQIIREYGRPPKKSPLADYYREYGESFLKAQKIRAAEAAKIRENEKTRAERQRKNQQRHSGGGRYGANAGNYVNGNPGVAAAVMHNPLRQFADMIVRMFETFRDRSISDEDTAKRQAVASKKRSEYRHVLIISLIVLVVLSLFIALVYRFGFVIKDVSVLNSTIYADESIVEASGLLKNVNLYSFSAKQSENMITFNCPYIRSVTLSRHMPSSVILEIYEDTPKYYANIWGDELLLSDTLRVLGKAGEDKRGLTEIILPSVVSSVAGRPLQFADRRNDTTVRSILSLISDAKISESGTLNRIDVSNQFSISIRYKDIYDITVGSMEDLDRKLDMVYATVETGNLMENAPARITLEGNRTASVRYVANLQEK